MGFLVETVFLKDNENIIYEGARPYYYFINTSLFLENIKYLIPNEKEVVRCEDKPPIITVKNNNGYTYRGSRLAVTAYTYVPEDDYKRIDCENTKFREIIELTKVGTAFYNHPHYITSLFPWEQMRIRFIADGVLKVKNKSEDDNSTQASLNLNDYFSATTTATTQPYSCTINDILYTFDTIQPYKEEINKNSNKAKKGNNMNNFDRIFKFGPASDVAMSIYGPAFKSCGAENWISRNDGEWIDASDLLLDINTSSFCYMMPVAKSNVREGDYILHKNKWAYVSEVHETFLEVEIMSEQEIVNVLPVRNPFGFEFYTKLITPFENGFAHADSSNPFGMLPLLMMMGKNDNKNNSMLPLMLMMNGGALDMSNPMMLMMMCDNGDNNLLPMMLMMQQMQTQNTANPNVTTKV